MTFSDLTVARSSLVKRPTEPGWASVVTLISQGSGAAVTPSGEVDTAGKEEAAVEAACRVSDGVAISWMSELGLLVHLSCSWEGTERWAEVEAGEMACVGRTSRDSAVEVQLSC
jgi:hypothetical protein